MRERVCCAAARLRESRACVRACVRVLIVYNGDNDNDNDNTAPWHDCLTQPAKELTIDTLDTKDLMLLHQLIFNYKSKLLDMLSEEIEKNEDKDWSQEEQLFEVLDMLGPPPSKAERKPRGALRMTVLYAVVLLCTHAIARAGACAFIMQSNSRPYHSCGHPKSRDMSPRRRTRPRSASGSCSPASSFTSSRTLRYLSPHGGFSSSLGIRRLLTPARCSIGHETSQIGPTRRYYNRSRTRIARL